MLVDLDQFSPTVVALLTVEVENSEELGKGARLDLNQLCLDDAGHPASVVVLVEDRGHDVVADAEVAGDVVLEDVVTGHVVLAVVVVEFDVDST